MKRGTGRGGICINDYDDCTKYHENIKIFCVFGRCLAGCMMIHMNDKKSLSSFDFMYVC